MLIIGTAQIKVNNVAEYAGECRWWAIRIVDGEAWFYGAFDTEKEATKAAKEIGGMVVENQEVE